MATGIRIKSNVKAGFGPWVTQNHNQVLATGIA